MMLSRRACKRAAPRLVAGLLVIMAYWPAMASAQSMYGCRYLQSALVPSYEGRQGVFFRIDPDLLNSNRWSDAVIGWIAQVSDALAEQGTALVVLPVPTKALAMPQYLGPEVAAFAYDPALATTIYEDNLTRLAGAGVVTVDARSALLNSVAGELTYFKSDPRLTSAGLSALARATAEKLGEAVAGEPPFVTVSSGMTTLKSADRIFLQMQCSASLPEVSSMGFSTERKGGDGTDTPVPVVVVGTEMTGTAELNFAGFLAELSGLAVTRQSVAGDALAALSGYLLSDGFRRQRPEYVVWEIPVWSNPALHGDQPMREAIAAARNECEMDLEATIMDDGKLQVDLSGVTPDPERSLMLETPDTKAARADFRFVGQNGLARTRAVQRSADTPLTGRFYMPLTGLWDAGIAMVEITTDFDPGLPPRVSLCRG